MAFDGARAFVAPSGTLTGTTADFDHDGKPDIAVISKDPHTLSIFRNNGNGTFAKATSYPLSNLPSSIACADFNGDGWVDLAVSNSSNAGGWVSIFPNNKDGSFSHERDYNAPFPGLVQIADFNGDAKPDLVVSSGGSVLIFQNSGDGTFADRVAYATAADARVVPLDVDGDGKSDLAFGNYTTNTLSVLRNNGDGTFAPKVDYPTGTHPVKLIAGDFDGDGKSDLVVANGNDSYFSVMRNNGDGTFAPKVDYGQSFLGSNYIAAADLTGDGRPELITTTKQLVSVWQNKGDGTFAAKVDYDAGYLPGTVMAADFDGDKGIDVAVFALGAITILTNRNDGTFVTGKDYFSGTSSQALAAADFDGNGSLDLAVANTNGLIPGRVTILSSNGDGTFVTAASYQALGYPSSVVAADFNGDGKPDLAVGQGDSKDLTVLLNKGDGTFFRKVLYPTVYTPYCLVADDVNGDGSPDLAVANPSSNTVGLLMNNGDGTFASYVTYTVGQDPEAVVIADWNADGKPDLAVANLKSNSVSILRNQGNGTFAAKTDYNMGFLVGRGMAAGDFDGDGKPDLIVGSYLLRNKGDGTFAPKVYIPGAAGISVTAIDLNGDGCVDLAATGSTTVSALINNGDGTFALPVVYATGGTPEGVVAADFDGDGKPDLATANFNGGNVTFLRNITTEQTPPIVISAQFRFDRQPQSLAIAFSEWVGDKVGQQLILTNQTTGQVFGPTEFAYKFDAAAHVGTWTFPNMPKGRLPDGNYSISLPAGAVLDASGNQMTHGFMAEFFVLSADINRDRAVDALDLAILAHNYNSSSGRTWADGDLTGDGIVDFNDLVMLAQHYNTSLSPIPPAPLAAGWSPSGKKGPSLPAYRPTSIKRAAVAISLPPARRNASLGTPSPA